MDQEQQPRERSFTSELVPDWRPTREQMLWAVRLAVAVVVLLGVFLFLYVISFLFGRTVWELLKVLAVPIAIGAAVPLLNWLQKKRELEVENQRAQDEALQAYLDQMSQLLLDKDKPLRQSEEDSEVRILARARTLTVLARLDGLHEVQVVQFLYESDLIAADRPVVLDLGGADLSWADLRKADLSFANLIGADLSDAVLGRAHLSNARGVTEEQLTEAKSLQGAIMPNGQKYEDWLKRREEEKRTAVPRNRARHTPTSWLW